MTLFSAMPSIKKIALLLVCCGSASNICAQNEQTASVEGFSLGLQTNFMGIMLHQEVKLAHSVAFRVEFGLSSLLFEGSPRNGDRVLMVATITTEPKWYYNLTKRAQESRDISGNSGNFIALKIDYSPNWFYIEDGDGSDLLSTLVVTPIWGIRRNLSPHFNYEAGFGVGYAHVFDGIGKVVPRLHLRLGYRFKMRSKKSKQ